MVISEGAQVAIDFAKDWAWVWPRGSNREKHFTYTQELTMGAEELYTLLGNIKSEKDSAPRSSWYEHSGLTGSGIEKDNFDACYEFVGSLYRATR